MLLQPLESDGYFEAGGYIFESAEDRFRYNLLISSQARTLENYLNALRARDRRPHNRADILTSNVGKPQADHLPAVENLRYKEGVYDLDLKLGSEKDHWVFAKSSDKSGVGRIIKNTGQFSIEEIFASLTTFINKTTHERSRAEIRDLLKELARFRGHKDRESIETGIQDLAKILHGPETIIPVSRDYLKDHQVLPEGRSPSDGLFYGLQPSSWAMNAMRTAIGSLPAGLL